MDRMNELLIFRSHPRFKDYEFKKKQENKPKPLPGDVTTRVNPEVVNFRDMSRWELLKFLEKHEKVFEHYGLKIDTDRYYTFSSRWRDRNEHARNIQQ